MSSPVSESFRASLMIADSNPVRDLFYFIELKILTILTNFFQKILVTSSPVSSKKYK